MRCLSLHPGNVALHSCRALLSMKRALSVLLYGLRRWLEPCYPEYEKFNVVKMKVISDERKGIDGTVERSD